MHVGKMTFHCECVYALLKYNNLLLIPVLNVSALAGRKSEIILLCVYLDNLHIILNI